MKFLSDQTDGALLGEKGSSTETAAPPEISGDVNRLASTDALATAVAVRAAVDPSPDGSGPGAEQAGSGASTRAMAAELDRFGIGMFRLNRQGYLIEFNDSASEVLGVDHTTPWDELHIGNIDRSLKTGLFEQFDAILEGNVRYVRRRLRAANRLDRHMLINLSAAPLSNGNGNSVLGIVHEIDRASDQTIRAREELHILAEVASALSSSLELPQILRAILTGATASQGLGFNRAFLFLYDDTRHELTGHMAVGPNSPEEAGHIWQRLDGLHLSLGQLLDGDRNALDPATDSLSERIRGLTIDLHADSLLSQLCDQGGWANLERADEIDDLTAAMLERLGTRNAAVVPLVSKGVCQGLLAADNFITQAPIFDDAVRVLKILADQAAVAIQRAKLFEAERRRTRELERANRRLAESQDHIVRAEKMSVMGELTSAVAQELRNPLTIIGGFVNLMLETASSDEQREYLQIISSEIKRSDFVLEQVLQFASASHEGNQVFDFSVLVSQAVDHLSTRAGETPPRLHLSLAHEKLRAFGNRDQLASALNHLLTLVLDEIPPQVGVEVRTEAQGDRLRLTLAFTCPNNHQHCLQRSLEQLFARQTTSQRLPVLVAAETIKYHGGDFGLTYLENDTSVVYVELPRATESGDDSD